MADTSIKQANKAYERWLRTQLDGDIVESDLHEKWDKMAEGPFPFLRATYWRWAETILDIAPTSRRLRRCSPWATSISRTSAPGATMTAAWSGA